MSLRSCGLLARLIATASVARMERSEIRDWLPNVPHPHVAALMRATCSPHRNSKRSPDERSDIRDWLPNLPHPHVAALMRATCSPHRNSKRRSYGVAGGSGGKLSLQLTNLREDQRCKLITQTHLPGATMPRFILLSN